MSRARNRAPKNPQTRQQTAQRIIMRQTVRAYSVLKEICDHSFQGYGYGAPCMNRFNSLNADLLRKIALDYAADNTKYPGWFENATPPEISLNPFIVSEGTLKGIDVFIEDETKHVAEVGSGAPASLSYADMIAFLGIQTGDQLTVMQIDHDGYLHYGRFIFAPKSGDLTKLVTDSTEFNDANEGSVVWAIDSNQLTVNVGDDSDTMLMCAIIVSRRADNGEWLRSSSAFVVNEGVDGYPITQAMAGSAVPLPAGSQWYLNQAESVAAEGNTENP